MKLWRIMAITLHFSVLGTSNAAAVMDQQCRLRFTSCISQCPRPLSQRLRCTSACQAEYSFCKSTSAR
jgi:hypothetical protein